MCIVHGCTCTCTCTCSHQFVLTCTSHFSIPLHLIFPIFLLQGLRLRRNILVSVRLSKQLAKGEQGGREEVHVHVHREGGGREGGSEKRRSSLEEMLGPHNTVDGLGGGVADAAARVGLGCGLGLTLVTLTLSL